MTTPLDQEQDVPPATPAAPRAPELPPLWTDEAPPSGEGGEDQEATPPPTAPNSGPPEFDLWEGFEQALQAWTQHVPAERGTADDLRTTLADDLQALDRAARPDSARWDAVTGPASVPPPVRETAATPTQDGAAAVNAAVAAADSHADQLRDLPEWQRLQTVRGAAKHLFDTFRKRAGEHWNAFWNDARVQGFWRTVSIRAAEGISHLATAIADRLRAGAAGDRPAAEAMSEVGRAAAAYSTSAGGSAAAADPPAESRSGTPPMPADQEEAQPQARTSAALSPADGAKNTQPTPAVWEESRPDQSRAATPPADQDGAQPTSAVRNEARPYESRAAAVRASQGVMASFKSWIDTPMGRELAKSTNPKVVAFREAWQQLPSADLPKGPGPAAGPYGEVAVKARALVEAAVASGRFTRVDIMALRALSSEAGTHAGRLAVTLPGTPPGSPAAAAAQPAAATPRPQVPAPAPPAARGPRAGM